MFIIFQAGINYHIWRAHGSERATVLIHLWFYRKYLEVNKVPHHNQSSHNNGTSIQQVQEINNVFCDESTSLDICIPQVLNQAF